MYFLLESDTMLLFRLIGFKLKPPQQEKLYWDVLKLLNKLECEEMSNHIARSKKTPSPTVDSGYGIFWDEYRSIERSNPQQNQPDTEDGAALRCEDKNESEIQWLNDVGFTNIAKKIRARTEIHRNDDDMKIIAASLTRAQANAVRKRIDSLNDAIRQRKVNDDKDKFPSQRNRNNRKDVRNVFNGAHKAHGMETGAAVESSKRQHDFKRPNLVGPRYVGIPGPSKDVDLTSKDVLLSQGDNKFQGSPQHQRSTSLSQNGNHSKLSTPKPIQIPQNFEPDSLQTANADFRPAPKSPTLQRVQNQTPQIDNLVRRTSGASHLIYMTGAEREKSLTNLNTQSTGPTKNTDLGPRSLTLDSPEHRRRSAGARLFEKPAVPNKTHRKTNSSDGLVNTYHVQGRAVVDPTNKLLSGGEKRLVIVDSKYININTVGDSYKEHLQDGKQSSTSTNSEVCNNTRQVRMTVNRNQKNSSSYTSDQRSNSPQINYENLRQPSPLDNHSESSKNNNANISSKNNMKSQHKIAQNNYENQQKLIQNKLENMRVSPESNLLHEHSVDIKTNDILPTTEPIPHKLEIKDPFPDLVHTPEEIRKKNKEAISIESKEIKTEDQKVTIYDDSPRERQNADVKLVKTKSSPLPNRKISTDVHVQSGSDDSKSLSSFGSLGSSDDLQLSPMSDKTFDPYSKPQKSNRQDVNAINNINAGDSRSSTPRGESPGAGLEGDAKLDVGSIGSPRGSVSTPEVLSGPSFPPLPNFTLTREELGMTYVGDLSEEDMTKVRSLALLELTALFDAYAIPMNRRKALAKQKYKDNGMFGVPLTTICHREQTKKNPIIKAPRIFQEMLTFLVNHGLEEEGILRIPGSTPRVKAFREACDKNKLDEVNFEGKKISDISTVVKQFLRDLPIPLLSYEYQNTFTSVANLPDRKVQLQALNLLVLLLHPVHQETLRILLIFLNKIVLNESKNKMGLNNVAMIIAPNLFFQNNTKINIDEASKAAGMTDVLRMLIKYQVILWTIPSFMVGQIRYLYEAGAKTKDPKAVRKIIAKRLKSEGPITTPRGKSEGPITTPRGKSSGSSGDELEDFEENFIIRVKAPSLNKQSMAIQVSDKMTPTDVIAKFQWRRQNSQKEKDEIDTSRLSINRSSKKKEANLELYLCETGGNIGERRLDPDASLAAVLKVNPNAEWVLKGCVKK